MMDDGLFSQFPWTPCLAMHNTPGIPQGGSQRPDPTMARHRVVITLNGARHGAIRIAPATRWLPRRPAS